MAMNAKEAHAMLAASRRNPSRIAQIVPSRLTLPVDRTVVDLIGDGGTRRDHQCRFPRLDR